MSTKTPIKAKVLAHTTGISHEGAAQIIEAAGRTCYKSFEKITNDSAEKFVNMVLRRGHESVIEHSWFVFQLPKNSFKTETSAKFLLNLLMKSRLFVITERDDDYILSGNARMFRDYFKSLRGRFSIEDVTLLEQLKKDQPIIFSDIELPFRPMAELNLKINPKIEYSRTEKLKHFWAVVRFTGGSRAFTHQLVRHRLCAISQESQRYCDEAGFTDGGYYATPPSIKESGMENDYDDKMKQIDTWYKEYQNVKDENGKKKILNEDARFLLPNAVCAEIVVSANLEEWRWIFHMRCNSHAQWEIRELCMQALVQLKEIFPGCFDDFIISSDGKTADIK